MAAPGMYVMGLPFLRRRKSSFIDGAEGAELAAHLALWLEVITTGLLNAVVAEDLPGPGTVFLETNWRFLKAVRVGEAITAEVCVTDVREDKPICKLETRVSNEQGEICVTGTAVTFTVPLRNA